MNPSVFRTGMTYVNITRVLKGLQNDDDDIGLQVLQPSTEDLNLWSLFVSSQQTESASEVRLLSQQADAPFGRSAPSRDSGDRSGAINHAEVNKTILIILLVCPNSYDLVSASIKISLVRILLEA